MLTLKNSQYLARSNNNNTQLTIKIYKCLLTDIYHYIVLMNGMASEVKPTNDMNDNEINIQYTESKRHIEISDYRMLF